MSQWCDVSKHNCRSDGQSQAGFQLACPRHTPPSCCNAPATQCATAPGPSVNQRSLRDLRSAAIFPGDDSKVILQCVSISIVRQHLASLQVKSPFMNNVMLPFGLAMTSFFDVIFQCSAVQFVLQRMAYLEIRWPCMTRVMLPVYLTMTTLFDVISQCSASQFVQQHMPV